MNLTKIHWVPQDSPGPTSLKTYLKSLQKAAFAQQLGDIIWIQHIFASHCQTDIESSCEELDLGLGLSVICFLHNLKNKKIKKDEKVIT